MVENKVLELETRRRIFTVIKRSPGLHVRELSRTLGIPLSTLDYHLYFLKQRGLITEKQDGRYIRYYCVGDIGTKEQGVISLLRQSVPRSILMFLLLHPHSSHHDVCVQIGLAPSTISFHLKKLLDIQIVTREQQGKDTSYYVNDSDHVLDLLITYQKTFLDESVDRFIETWFNLNPDHLKKSEKEKKKSV
jgi:predicted transcriptional regulator